MAGKTIARLFDPSLAEVEVHQHDQLWGRVAQRLRQEIFTGQSAPGARLVETRIAGQLGVAQSSVREALHQLEKEGLVTRRAGVGACVVNPSRIEIDQIYELRAQLEGFAVELVGRKCDSRDLEALILRIAACQRAAERGPLEYMMADFEFHSEIWDRSGNVFLAESLSRIVIPLFAFETRVVVPLLSQEDRAHSVETHRHVVELLQARKAAEARCSMAHIIEEFWHQTRGLSRE